MESTMCHDDGVDYSATSSPSPVYTSFFTARYNKHLAFFFCSTQRMVHAAAFICVGRARLSVCIIVCIVVRSGHALFLHLPRVLQLSFLAISLRSLSVMDPH